MRSCVFISIVILLIFELSAQEYRAAKSFDGKSTSGNITVRISSGSKVTVLSQEEARRRNVPSWAIAYKVQGSNDIYYTGSSILETATVSEVKTQVRLSTEAVKPQSQTQAEQFEVSVPNQSSAEVHPSAVLIFKKNGIISDSSGKFFSVPRNRMFRTLKSVGVPNGKIAIQIRSSNNVDYGDQVYYIDKSKIDQDAEKLFDIESFLGEQPVVNSSAKIEPAQNSVSLDESLDGLKRSMAENDKLTEEIVQQTKEIGEKLKRQHQPAQGCVIPAIQPSVANSSDWTGEGPECSAPEKCHANRALQKGDPKRHQFDAYIAEAANAYGLNPALLKALIQRETNFDFLAENLTEKNALEQGKGMVQYKWGKGLGQFGANNSSRYNLKWNVPKPKREEAYSEVYNKPDSTGQFPIWSPRGSILAVAKYMRENKDRSINMKLNNQETMSISVGSVYADNEEESARFLAGMHNRGLRPLYSIGEHYRQEGVMPSSYGKAWSVKRKQETQDNLKLLFGQFINRCHVFVIAGLCPGQQGLMQKYQGDYKLVGGKWVINT